MLDLMLDLETLSTDSNALVTTISAVQFDKKTGEIGKEFEIGLRWDEQQSKGASLDVKTIEWWLTQSKDAQKTMMRKRQVNVNEALQSFNSWIGESFSNEFNAVKLWGNGVGFDNTILRSLYKRHDVEFVLPYWCDNDVRTWVSIKGINPREFEFEGVKHRGIDDCKHQIKYCCS